MGNFYLSAYSFLLQEEPIRQRNLSVIITEHDETCNHWGCDVTIIKQWPRVVAIHKNILSLNCNFDLLLEILQQIECNFWIKNSFYFLKLVFFSYMILVMRRKCESFIYLIWWIFSSSRNCFGNIPPLPSVCSGNENTIGTLPMTWYLLGQKKSIFSRKSKHYNK